MVLVFAVLVVGTAASAVALSREEAEHREHEQAEAEAEELAEAEAEGPAQEAEEAPGSPPEARRSQMAKRPAGGPQHPAAFG